MLTYSDLKVGNIYRCKKSLILFAGSDLHPLARTIDLEVGEMFLLVSKKTTDIAENNDRGSMDLKSLSGMKLGHLLLLVPETHICFEEVLY